MERFRLTILAESRIRWKVYVRFGGEYWETYHRNMTRRRVLSLHKLLEIILKKEYDLLWAKNGKEAVAYALSHNPDAVLMDIKMPVMDGIEALKEIRLHTDSLPVIMQTAYAFDTDRRVAEEAGCNGFITKPVMPRELKMYLDKYLTK